VKIYFGKLFRLNSKAILNNYLEKTTMISLLKSLIHCLVIILFLVNGLIAYADEQDNSSTLPKDTDVKQSLNEKYMKALQSVTTKEQSLLQKITRSAWNSPPKEPFCLQLLLQASEQILKEHDFSSALQLYQQVVIQEKDCSKEAITIAKNKICLIQLQQDAQKLETNVIESLQLYHKLIEEDCPKEVITVAQEKFCLDQYLQQYKYMEASNFVEVLQIYQQMIDENCPKYIMAKTNPIVEFAKKNLCLIQYEQANEKEKAGEFTEALQLYRYMLEEKCQYQQMNKLAKDKICLVQYQQIKRQIRANNIPTDSQLYQLEKVCQNIEETIIVAALGSIVKLGKNYENQQRFAQSQKIYQNVLPITKNILGKEHALVSVILYRLASTFESLANYGLAKKYWKNALLINEKIYGLEHPKVANVLGSLADIENNLGNFKKSKSLLKRARTIYDKESSKHIGVYLVKSELANIEMRLGNFRHSESLLKEILEICEKSDVSEKHQCLLLEEPVEELQQVPDNDYAYVAVLSQLATFYASLNDYSQAELLLKKVLAIKIKFYHPEHPDVTKTLKNLADGTINYPEHPEIAKILGYLATIVDEPLGYYMNAEERLNKALAIYQKVYKNQPHTEIAKILRYLASVHTAQSNYDKAKSLYRRAITIYQKIYDPQNYYLHPYQLDEPPHPDIADTLIELAGVYQRVGDNAWTQFKSLLAQRNPSTKKTVMELFATNLLEHAQAELYFEDALAIYKKVYGSQHPDVALAISSLASLSQKVTNYIEALPTIINSSNPQLLWVAQSQISLLLAQQNNRSAAIFFGKQAVNILKNIQSNIPLDKTLQRSFIKDKTMYFKYLINLLIEQKRLPEALQILEMFKEEEYFDFTRRSADVRTTQVSYTDFEQIWVDRYTTLTQQLAKLEHEKRTLESKLEHGLTDVEKIRLTKLENYISAVKQSLIKFLKELKVAFKQADIKEVAKTPGKAKNNLKALQNTLSKLGHGAVLVYYLIFEDKLVIMLVTPNEQIVRHVAINQKHLSEILSNFLATLQNEDEQVREEGLPLYELLIKPIETDLAQAKALTLMVSLDGPLRYMPIAALHDGKQYMAERYAIVRYTQTTKNILQRPSKPTQWRAAGLGVNKKVRKEFWPLNGVDEELKRIVCLNENNSDCVFPGNIYLNEKFTATTLQQVLTENYSLLHIASHFKFDSSSELSSFLLLGDNTELTLATIREKYNFSGIDLLTLSACDTAVSVPRNGREIEGFGILAQNKGARGIISTLWLTDNQAAIQFMPEFYRALTENPESTKAQALQKNQKDFISSDKYAHPYYWAPFILMGNWL
jgi:CHAT domain-containing protein